MRPGAGRDQEQLMKPTSRTYIIAGGSSIILSLAVYDLMPYFFGQGELGIGHAAEISLPTGGQATLYLTLIQICVYAGGMGVVSVVAGGLMHVFSKHNK